MSQSLAVYIVLVLAAAILSLAGVYLLVGPGPTLIVASVEALAASEVLRRGMNAPPGAADVE